MIPDWSGRRKHAENCQKQIQHGVAVFSLSLKSALLSWESPGNPLCVISLRGPCGLDCVILKLFILEINQFEVKNPTCNPNK